MPDGDTLRQRIYHAIGLLYSRVPALAPFLAVPPEQDTALQDRRAWTKLARVLGELDAPKREAFVLYELEALPMTEVAAILECPLQTAYARLHAARRAVLAAFAGREPA